MSRSALDPPAPLLLLPVPSFQSPPPVFLPYSSRHSGPSLHWSGPPLLLSDPRCHPSLPAQDLQEAMQRQEAPQNLPDAPRGLQDQRAAASSPAEHLAERGRLELGHRARQVGADASSERNPRNQSRLQPGPPLRGVKSKAEKEGAEEPLRLGSEVVSSGSTRRSPLLTQDYNSNEFNRFRNTQGA